MKIKDIKIGQQFINRKDFHGLQKNIYVVIDIIEGNVEKILLQSYELDNTKIRITESRPFMLNPGHHIFDKKNLCQYKIRA